MTSPSWADQAPTPAIGIQRQKSPPRQTNTDIAIEEAIARLVADAPPLSPQIDPQPNR